MSKLQVTQTKSGIGRKQNQRDTLRSLGLRKIHQEVVREDDAVTLGMINAVRHLVTVEEV